MFRPVALALLALVACRQGQDARPPPSVLVLSAFRGELQPLLDAAEPTEQIQRDGRTYYLGTLGGQRVILSLTGAGMAKARAATEAAIAELSPTAVIFVGVAGGIDPDLGVADVVVPAEWAPHDGQLAWTPVDPGLAALVPVDVDLGACDRQPPCASKPQIRPGGRGMSGSTFVHDPDDARRLWREHAARSVDMETSAAAEVAAAHHLPFLAFRGLSDVVSTGNSREDVRRFWPLAAENAARAAIAFFQRPAAVASQ